MELQHYTNLHIITASVVTITMHQFLSTC